MTLEQEAFQGAYKLCLCNCFDVMANGLVTQAGDVTVIARFERCCELCRQAKRVADEYGRTESPSVGG